MLANSWQGEFPWQNLMLDGYAGTSPVGAFPPNGYGLYDMTANVWEWTRDPFTESRQEPCCGPTADERIPRRVIKGGFAPVRAELLPALRPAARQGEAVDTATGHIGFRCVVRDA